MTNEMYRPSLFQIIYAAVWLLGTPVLVLWLSGDWLWVEGWVFDIWFLVTCVTTIVYLAVKDPALLRERMRRTGSTSQMKWDKFVVPVFTAMFVVWVIIMPLDAERYHWSPTFPIWLKVIGGAVLLVSTYFMIASFAENTFASALVRIQSERHQRVITTGPYAFVRHPLYLGGILMQFGVPVLLGSVYGILLGAAVTAIIMIRIIGEERMLLSELEGYDAYRRKVKYRLIPHVW